MQSKCRRIITIITITEKNREQSSLFFYPILL